jgi:poly(3-hydroxybutyrate) depolymerase
VLYNLYELNRAMLGNAAAWASMGAEMLANPALPMAHSGIGPVVASALEVFAHAAAPRGKPAFAIETVTVGGEVHTVTEAIVLHRPFGNLLRFTHDGLAADAPSLLIVAPMSGHYATLLRGTVARMLERATVYVTDWTDAKLVPVEAGRFDLDDYIDYVIGFLEHIGPGAHMLAVCQPSVPTLAATAIMAADKHRCRPATLTMMGGPIDTRRNPTAVNLLAEAKGTRWFRDNVIMRAPWPVPGFGREVYPGFLQLSGFMSMNLDRHITAHKDFFMHLVKNDGDGAEKHREFYDEYLAVMDLTAEFYLQTVDTVFVKQALPKGRMSHRGVPVDPAAIRNVALFTVEGENDDISGLGQTEAAQDLCVNIPAERKAHYMQPAVGHYGVFNGSRFRAEIVPRIVDFIASHGRAERRPARPRLVKA